MKNQKAKETSEKMFEHFELFNTIAELPHGADLLKAATTGKLVAHEAAERVSELLLVAETVHAKQKGDTTVMLPAEEVLAEIIAKARDFLNSKL